jgi:hypothetical protein
MLICDRQSNNKEGSYNQFQQNLQLLQIFHCNINIYDLKYLQYQKTRRKKQTPEIQQFLPKLT